MYRHVRSVRSSERRPERRFLVCYWCGVTVAKYPPWNKLGTPGFGVSPLRDRSVGCDFHGAASVNVTGLCVLRLAATPLPWAPGVLVEGCHLLAPCSAELS